MIEVFYRELGGELFGVKNREKVKILILDSVNDIKRSIMFLHELSHQWFGNLVTPEWWDDIWLNESFAEYISCLCYDSLR